ncbi:MAG: PadR family transcriptional regulator [Thomasclavelia sp.]
MIPSQMLKGILEGCILVIIDRGDLYGYEITQKLEQYGFGKISEGTIYPLLLRLQRSELISFEIRESNQGPKRKYYYLTETGKSELENFKNNYHELNQAVSKLLEGMDINE